MQIENFEYTLDFDIDKVWNKIYETRRSIFEKEDRFNENLLIVKENERLKYILEDRNRKIEVDIQYISLDNKTKLKIYSSVKLRSVVLDLFSYLRVNIIKDFERYFDRIKGEMKNEI